jgi:hypothetical protein
MCCHRKGKMKSSNPDMTGFKTPMYGTDDVLPRAANLYVSKANYSGQRNQISARGHIVKGSRTFINSMKNHSRFRQEQGDQQTNTLHAEKFEKVVAREVRQRKILQLGKPEKYASTAHLIL